MPLVREQVGDEREAASTALDAYLGAPDSSTADQCLGELVTLFATPAIERAARSRLRQHAQAKPEDFDDICSEAVVALITELQSLRDQPGDQPIQDFPAFAATLAHRACSSWSRRVFPAFHGLRNRLRYVLQKDSNLALWQTPDHRWLCSLAKWAPGAQSLDLAPGPLPSPETFDDLTSISHPAEALLRIFKRVGHPVAFDELTRVMARLWSVQDARVPVEEDTLITEAPDFESSADRRQWLQWLWQEIELLLPRQRAALLLNLRDDEGCCATSVFVLTGIVSLAQMGFLLGFPELEFAELWKSMPLGDQVIAERLGVTRQQVINLRKCARERLSRRMANRKNPA